MKITNLLLGFLFGRLPKIFDKDGTVRHHLSKNRWKKWKNIYQQGNEYNWKRHKGMRGGEKSKQSSIAFPQKSDTPIKSKIDRPKYKE